MKKRWHFESCPMELTKTGFHRLDQRHEILRPRETQRQVGVDGYYTDGGSDVRRGNHAHGDAVGTVFGPRLGSRDTVDYQRELGRLAKFRGRGLTRTRACNGRFLLSLSQVWTVKRRALTRFRVSRWTCRPTTIASNTGSVWISFAAAPYAVRTRRRCFSTSYSPANRSTS